MNSRIVKIIVCAFVISVCAGMVFGQDSDEAPTELVITDFKTTGLGDNSSIAFGLGGLFEGSAIFDLSFDFFVSPLVALRLSVNTSSLLATAEATAFDIGFGAVWRSYVINRVRFYGGLLVRVGINPFTDVDLLLIPEGFGGFEFYAGPKVAMYAEFGGRSAIPIVSLNDGEPPVIYSYAEGFFFKVGTRFGLW